MLDLRRLQLLSEFSHRGTIAGTAAALGYTPSAVSQQLSTLEREVGAQLLDRTARSAELTDSGQLLAAHAEQILAMVEAAESVMAAQTGVAMGRVTVTAFPTAAIAFAPALAQSLRVHEGMQLVLRQSAALGGRRQVAAGEVDMALVDDWSGDRPTTAAGKLRFYPLLHEPMVLAVPVAHPLADPERPVDLRRLRDESWLAAPHGEPSRTATDRLLADVGGAPAAAWEFEGPGTILNLVARGVGIAVVPSLAVLSGPGGLAYRRLPHDAPIRDVYAVVRAASVQRPAIRVTLEACYAAARDVQRTLDSILGERAFPPEPPTA
ncbi:LysR family transcriptional regulator [Marinitenerispora sediminis]|uniref:LysR family transcriptional regulator n=1 Tax=Marinitenerispora sediminis TaxID=1931232 RepID=A0A368SZH1_9ACTN|nr:LysR family transcriptional regulator [Marinitenerispora sediminis]RCV51111.1 LysR family transcriptional regulator [Marinitenerispora sediminis]RCV52744.1 LysR family transcriptional regulator [Marinitenerispora sediminis]RCV54254.1 LysR family transcriptional regulator [Marinitenerispora sediminis]